MNERRKGYSRRSDIPADVLGALNEGRDEAVTLAEALGIDMPQLLRHAARDVGLEERGDWLGAQADGLASEGVMKRLAGIGAALFAALDNHPGRAEVFEALSTHPSDTVRSWATYVNVADPSLGLSERLARARPFASDGHMGVRECAWTSFRPYLVAELSEGLRLLSGWVRDGDPNVRRCAVEGTRPRGVWCAHIPELKEDPERGPVILEPVRSDPSRYVQLAAGNWLNDASKTCSEWTTGVCDRWTEESPTPETASIVRRGLRTLRRAGVVE